VVHDARGIHADLRSGHSLRKHLANVGEVPASVAGVEDSWGKRLRASLWRQSRPLAKIENNNVTEIGRVMATRTGPCRAENLSIKTRIILQLERTRLRQ
jgi:hypothetical protein